MMLHQFPADGLMRLAAAEEHAVGHDAGALAALFQHAQEERKKQQFRFFGAGHGLQGIADAFGVDAALERRICQAHGERGVHGIFLGYAVPVADIRMIYGVQHEIHGRNAQHGGVGVIAGEGGAGKMIPLSCGHGAFVVRADVFGGRNKKSRRAAGRVADDVVGRGVQKRDHHVADVLGRAELAVTACCGDLAEHVFIQIALHVEAGNVVFIQCFQPGDHLFQHLRRGHEKYGVLHEMSKGRLSRVVVTVGQGNERACFLVEVRQSPALHALDGRKDAPGNDVEHVLSVFVLELAPAHGLAEGRLRKDFFALHAESFVFFVFQFFDVQRADEHKIGQLFNDGERIGQARGKDVEPDFINAIFYGPCYHGLLLNAVVVDLPERAGTYSRIVNFRKRIKKGRRPVRLTCKRGRAFFFPSLARAGMALRGASFCRHLRERPGSRLRAVDSGCRPEEPVQPASCAHKAEFRQGRGQGDAGGTESCVHRADPGSGQGRVGRVRQESLPGARKNCRPGGVERLVLQQARLRALARSAIEKIQRKAAARRRPAGSGRENRGFCAKRQAVWFETQRVASRPCSRWA